MIHEIVAVAFFGIGVLIDHLFNSPPLPKPTVYVLKGELSFKHLAHRDQRKYLPSGEPSLSFSVEIVI